MKSRPLKSESPAGLSAGLFVFRVFDVDHSPPRVRQAPAASGPELGLGGLRQRKKSRSAACEFEGVSHAQHGLGAAEEEPAILGQGARQLAEYGTFLVHVEIDQYVSAEDDVEDAESRAMRRPR